MYYNSSGVLYNITELRSMLNLHAGSTYGKYSKIYELNFYKSYLLLLHTLLAPGELVRKPQNFD